MMISRAIASSLVFFMMLGSLAPLAVAEDDAPLTMQDIIMLRRQKKKHEQIVDIAKERGLDFVVDAAMSVKLKRMGFSTVHVEQLKLIRAGESEPDHNPEAGHAADEGGDDNIFINDNAQFGPRKPDGWHDKQIRMVKEMVSKSGLALVQAKTKHFSIWATKDTAAMHGGEVQKLEKILDKKFGDIFEIKKGLDPRSANIVLINDDYSYKKFIEAMFEVYKMNGITFDGRDPKGLALEASAFSTPTLSIVNLSKVQIGPASKTIVIYQAGSMMMQQITEGKSTDAMDCGFGNVCEVLMYGRPSTTSQSYEMRELAGDNEWVQLVRQRISDKTLSRPSQVLTEHSTVNMEMPQYAECWSLIQLLTSAPDKFVDLVKEVRDGKSLMATIIEKYKLKDEKDLMKKWVKSVG